MSDVTDGIGGVIEGGLAGRAVEPKDGEAGVGGEAAESTQCTNCGAMITSAYCPQCGQKRDVHRSLAAIGHDLIHGVLHLDGKFWNTLPLLVFKPGQLTRRYIDGERVKFVSPMAMFLFGVFAMFAAFQFAGLSVPTDLERDTTEQLRQFANTEIERLRSQREALAEQLEATDLDPEQRAALEQELTDADTALAALSDAGREIPFLEGIAEGDASTAPTGLVPTGQNEDGDVVIPFSIDGVDNANLTIEDSFLEVGIEKWQEDPGLMLYKLQTNAYKFSWLLIPISIPFVWLLFIHRRRFKAYDHAIFVTYSISFMSLLFIALSLLTAAGVGGGWMFLSLIFIPPIHLYKQLRGTYELGRFGSLWRLMALSLFIWIVIALFLQTLLVLGAL